MGNIGSARLNEQPEPEPPASPPPRPPTASPLTPPASSSKANGGALTVEPGRNFRGVRLAFTVLLIAAIVLPFIYVSLAALTDLNNRRQAAMRATERVARIAEEHAIKVFDLNQSLDQRVNDLLGTLSDQQIQLHQQELYEKLRNIGGGYPQVSAVSVWGRKGELLINSQVYPAPALSFTDRPEYPAIKESHSLDISVLRLGSLFFQPIFNTSMARRDRTGHYVGIVSVALRARYFYDFYKELAGAEHSMTIGLVREGGALLVHYPPDSPADPLISTEADLHVPPPLRALAEMLTRLVGNSKDGGGSTVLKANGSESVIAYRRVGGYPAYVYASYPSTAIISAWLDHIELLAAGVFIPCFVLWVVILLSLRRLTVKERAYAAWQAEAATRRSVEAAFRHAGRMQALGHLVGSVAHDFNNLLMTMSANTQVLRRKGLSNADNQLSAIERAIKSGKGLTRQLLGGARKQPQNTEWIVLQTWLYRAASSLDSAIEHQIPIRIEVDPVTWPIQVGAAELELALVNLVLNARDAIGDPRSSNASIVIRVMNLHLGEGEAFAHAGDYVQLSITDNGVGMPTEVLNRAFEPLFTTKPLGMGAGLGLPQVSGFCAQSGGTATAESHVGEGTTVRLYLPRAVPPADAMVEEDVRHIRILLVEDNPEVAAGTEALLSVMGHEIQWFANADLAYARLSALKAEGVDMVLSDVHMPGTMNGIDLALRLRETHATLPVVLVTGYASELERARQANIPVLAKPFDVEVLESLIRQASRNVS